MHEVGPLAIDGMATQFTSLFLCASQRFGDFASESNLSAVLAKQQLNLFFAFTMRSTSR